MIEARLAVQVMSKAEKLMQLSDKSDSQFFKDKMRAEAMRVLEQAGEDKINRMNPLERAVYDSGQFSSFTYIAFHSIGRGMSFTEALKVDSDPELCKDLLQDIA